LCREYWKNKTSLFSKGPTAKKVFVRNEENGGIKYFDYVLGKLRSYED
jgi:hypothetical protein